MDPIAFCEYLEVGVEVLDLGWGARRVVRCVQSRVREMEMLLSREVETSLLCVGKWRDVMVLVWGVRVPSSRFVVEGLAASLAVGVGVPLGLLVLWWARFVEVDELVVGGVGTVELIW